MTSLLAVLLLMLIPASSSMDVAPQDADPFCLTEASTSNMIITDPRQVVLLDTLHYRPQELVSLFGGTEKWISRHFIGDKSNERVIIFCTQILQFYFVYYFFLVVRPFTGSGLFASTFELFFHEWTSKQLVDHPVH